MSALVSRLVTGDLLATGYATHSGIDEAAQTIAADRWRTLKPEISTSHATAPGVVISGVLVFAKGRVAPKLQNQRPAAPARVRRWYMRWVQDNVDEGRQPSRDEDLSAAREALGPQVQRDLLRQLRGELAPPAWRQFGRRKTGG